MPDEPPAAGQGPDTIAHRRAIRSFVARAGRMTVAQERAWRNLWPLYGTGQESNDALDLDALFGRSARRTLEIGFGNGASLVALAAAHPDEDFLGADRKFKPARQRSL